MVSRTKQNGTEGESIQSSCGTCEGCGSAVKRILTASMAFTSHTLRLPTGVDLYLCRLQKELSINTIIIWPWGWLPTSFSEISVTGVKIYIGNKGSEAPVTHRGTKGLAEGSGIPVRAQPPASPSFPEAHCHQPQQLH